MASLNCVHLGEGGYRVLCVVQDVGIIFVLAQSSAPVSVTNHPAELALFTVHSSPFRATLVCVPVFERGAVSEEQPRHTERGTVQLASSFPEMVRSPMGWDGEVPHGMGW
eukprot:362095-Chlamydomonas_euryale.AAC.1